MAAFKSPLHLACLALIASSGAAWASDPEADIAACTQIASSDERIRCLERALRKAAKAGDDEVILSGEDLEETANVPAPANVDTAKSAPVAEAQPPGSEAPSVAVSPNTDDAAGDGSIGPDEIVADSAATVELGDEQLGRDADKSREQQRIPANIVDFELVGAGRLRLTLDNGQVWLQTGDDDDRIARRIDKRDRVPVEMWRSRSGGYRMYLIDIDRTLRVRRIR